MLRRVVVVARAALALLPLIRRTWPGWMMLRAESRFIDSRLDSGVLVRSAIAPSVSPERTR